MENIIKKSIAGGYELRPYYLDESGTRCEEPVEVTVMNPLFWQALHKSCGWKEKNQASAYYRQFFKRNYHSGWDTAVVYLENLIK